MPATVTPQKSTLVKNGGKESAQTFCALSGKDTDTSGGARKAGLLHKRILGALFSGAEGASKARSPRRSAHVHMVADEGDRVEG